MQAPCRRGQQMAQPASFNCSPVVFTVFCSFAGTGHAGNAPAGLRLTAGVVTASPSRTADLSPDVYNNLQRCRRIFYMPLRRLPRGGMLKSPLFEGERHLPLWHNGPSCHRRRANKQRDRRHFGGACGLPLRSSPPRSAFAIPKNETTAPQSIKIRKKIRSFLRPGRTPKR